MYNLKVDPIKKQLIVTCEGMFTADIATNFIQELERKIRSIDPTNYNLVIDARKQKPSPQEVLPLQEKAMGLYINTPFKGRFNLDFESAVARSQVKRVGKSDVERLFTVVSSISDIK